MAKKAPKKKQRHYLRTFFFLILVAVLSLNTYLIWSMQTVVNRVDKYNQGVIDEIGASKGDIKLFANDLNEIRRFLLLPEVDYSVLEQKKEDGKKTDESNKDTVAVFAMLNAVAKEKNHAQRNQTAEQILKELSTNPDFQQKLSEISLQLGETNNLNLKFNDTSNSEFNGQPLFNLAFSADDNQFIIQSVLEDHQIKDYQNDQFSSSIINFFKENTEKAIAKKRQDQQTAAQESKESAENAKQEIEKRKANIQSLMKDPAFLDTIKNEGWKLEETPHEESNKFYYNILDTKSNAVVFAIGVELSSGMIKVIKDGQEIDVRSFLEDQDAKKKL